MYKFGHRFETIVITSIEDTRPAHTIPFVVEVLEALGSVTLGASTFEGLGYWQPTHEVERAIHIYAAYDGSEGTKAAIWDAVLPPLALWASQTGQQAVAVQWDNVLEIWDTPELLAQVLVGEEG